MIIKIQHQTQKTIHKFNVVDADKLTAIEVWAICVEMNVAAILVKGRYYETQ